MGRNFYGQLGDLTGQQQRKAVHVQSKNITMISCGGRHSMIAVKGKGLFTFGANSNGQLGVPCKESVLELTQIPGFIA